MMKKPLLIAILAPLAYGQFSSTAHHIYYGATLPATCNPNTGDVFFKTSATIGPNYCSATNTWTVMGSGGGSISIGATVTSGTTNSILYVASGPVLGQIATANNSVLATNGLGIWSAGTTLPTGLTIPGYQTSITGVANQVFGGSGPGMVALTDSYMPSDFCVHTKYTIAYNNAGLNVAATTATITLVTLGSTAVRICSVEMSGTTSFAGTGITAAVVQLQSGSGTPVVYTPTQDIFGTVGATTNNYWSEALNVVDRGNLNVNAFFKFTGGNANALTAGSVDFVVGTYTRP